MAISISLSGQYPSAAQLDQSLNVAPTHQRLLDWLVKARKCDVQDALWICRTIEQQVKGEISVLSDSVTWEAVKKTADLQLRKLKGLMDKNFGLSPIAFEQMVSRLREGDEQIFEKVFLQHFEACMNYLQKFCSASHTDAYDASMDALLEFCRRLQQGKIQYGNLRFLFTQMAKQIYFKRQKKNERLAPVDGLEEWEAPPAVSTEELDVLDKAWAQLCQECQGLLRQFYHAGISLKEIAEESNKSAAAIRKQKQRCIEKLRTLFVKYI